MKYICFLLAGFLFFSCNSAGGGSGSGDNVISFKVDGEQVNSHGFNVAFFQFGNMTSPGMNITSNMHEEKRTINVNLNGNKPGTYTIGHGLGETIGVYFPDYNESTPYNFTSGTFIITEVDSVKKLVNGTFSGEAKNNDNGKTVKITDGKIINATLKTDQKMPE